MRKTFLRSNVCLFTDLEILSPTAREDVPCLTSPAQQFENMELKGNSQQMSPNQLPDDLFEWSLSQSCLQSSSEVCEDLMVCSPDISYEEEWMPTPQNKTKLSSINGL